MNTWYENTVPNMAYVMAEDTGAPELRNPLNSAIHAERNNKPAIHPLLGLKALLTAMLAM